VQDSRKWRYETRELVADDVYNSLKNDPTIIKEFGTAKFDKNGKYLSTDMSRLREELGNMYDQSGNLNSNYKGFQIAGLSTTSSLVPLIDTTENYLISEFNPLINNVDSYAKSNVYYDLDYSNGMSTPINLTQVNQGSAEKAGVNDSNYSRESWNNIRYRGSRVTSPGINQV
jgi:hypothetical protein